MTRKMMTGSLWAAAALLAGSAIVNAQGSNQPGMSAPGFKGDAISGPAYAPGMTVYRLVDDPSSVTTGSAAEPEVTRPSADEGVTYSFGTTRLCTTSEFERGTC